LRILIVLSLVLFPLVLGIDKAHAAEGLTAQVYSVNGQNASPYIPQGASPILTTNVPNINFQWGSGQVLGGPSEDVIVVFTGSILSNTTQDISFLATGDDGTRLYLDGALITNDWVDKGGGGTTSAPVTFTAGVPKSIQLMYYENGGGANVFLYWDQSGSMDIIPASAFTSQAAPVVKTIGAPRNLTVSDNGSAVVLNWEAPNTGNTQPERYAINFSADGGGWGIATGNVGDDSALKTFMNIPYNVFESLKPSGTTWTFSIRSDNDTNSLYSEISNQVTVKIGKTQAEKDAEIAAANQSAANIVIASITNSNWATARSQYNALTDAQKSLVNNYQSLLDAEAAIALAIQQELDRQSAANTAVTNYENQPISTSAEVTVAESLKIIADSATAIVQNESVRFQLQSRIDAKTSAVLAAKIAIENARLQAEAAALLAAQQEAARLAAIAEAERLAELERQRLAAEAEAARIEAERLAAIAEAARIESERLAAIAEQERIAAEQEAARQAALAAEAARLAAIAEAARIEAERQAAIKAEQDRLAALAAAKAEADRLAAEAAAKKAEEERLAAEAAAKKAEEERIAAEIAKAKAEEEARLAEEARLKAEAEAKAAEEARLKAEEEARLAEEARLKAEAEAKAKAEEEARLEAERIAAEKAAEEQREKDRLAEEARLKAEAEAKAKAEEDARIERERIAAEEAKAKAEKERLEQIAKDKAALESKLLAEQKAKEAEAARLKAEAEAKAAEEKVLASGKITAEDTKKVLDNINADGKVTQTEVKNILDAIKQSDAPLTSEQKDLIATVVVAAAVSSGENVTAEQIQNAGIEYKDLPVETPVEVRADENGNVLVITAEVAAQVELVQDPGALLEAAFSDPGAALAALGSIGADMTEEEREEAKDMVVATVVATGAALNAVGLATGGSAPAAPSGGSSSGTNSGGSRRNERW
jgi:uncharacterized protein YqgV (UPF0045/DUF77 family)